MTANDLANVTELEQFLSSHPEVAVIDAIFPDLSGVIRGKRLTLDHSRQLFADGLQLPGSMLLLSITGSCMDPCGMGVSDGDPDVLIRPVTGTLQLVPWADGSRAQVMVRFLGEDAVPSSLEPRHLLANVVERLAELDLHPVVACELEFCLVDRDRASNGLPIRPASPQDGRRHESTQLMSLSYLDDFGGYVSDVSKACRELSIPVTALNAEYGGDQFEINLRHVDNAVLAADHAIHLKQVVQCVAVSHGIRATFMAKPYADTAGSGMHWHVSLLDGKGRNVFDDGSEAGSDTLRHAVGGILQTMPEAMAFFAPNINSYRRFKPGLFVPMTRSWGYNNRSVALRVPGGATEDRRLEHRVAGADANPYLAIAALLAGMHHGVSTKCSAPAASEGNACVDLDEGVPRRLHDALQALDGAKVLTTYFGRDYCDVYAACKRLELDAFLNNISAREISWYLRDDA